MRKSRRADALAIRDHMLQIMGIHGRSETIAGIRVNAWAGNGFESVVNTPFTPLPHAPPKPKSFADAAALQKYRPPMPYEISIWRRGYGKVLLLEWDHNGECEVVTFKRGSWEQELLSLVPESLKTGPKLD